METPAINTFNPSVDELEENEDVGFSGDEDVLNDPGFALFHHKASLQQMHVVNVADYPSLLTSMQKKQNVLMMNKDQIQRNLRCHAHLAKDRHL